MGDPVTFVEDVDYRQTSDGPDIVRLPARGGIEGGLIEVDFPGIIFKVNRVGAEISQIAISIIEPIGHTIHLT